MQAKRFLLTRLQASAIVGRMKSTMPIKESLNVPCMAHCGRAATFVECEADLVISRTDDGTVRVPICVTGAYCSQECAETVRGRTEFSGGVGRPADTRAVAPSPDAHLGAEEKA